MGRAFCRGRRRDARRSAIRNRPGAFRRPRPHGRHGRGRRGRPPAVQHRRHRARPDLLAAALGDDSAGQGRARRLLDRRRIVASRTARSHRQASRSQRLRPREDARLDAGPGAAAPSRRQGRRSGRLSAAGRADPLRRPRFRASSEAIVRGAGPSRACGRSASPATCRSSSCGSTISRTSPRCASCCAPTNTGG